MSSVDLLKKYGAKPSYMIRENRTIANSGYAIVYSKEDIKGVDSPEDHILSDIISKELAQHYNVVHHMNKDTRLYIKHCTLPLNEAKAYLKKFGAKITYNEEDATIFLIPPDASAKVYHDYVRHDDHTEIYLFNRNDFIEFIKSIPSPPLVKLIDKLNKETSTDSYIYFAPQYLDVFLTSVCRKYNVKLDEFIHTYRLHGVTYTDRNYNESVLDSNEEEPILAWDKILRPYAKGASISYISFMMMMRDQHPSINQDEFNRLVDMMESNEEANIVLVKGIISNLNLRDSFVYIAYLIIRYEYMFSVSGRNIGFESTSSAIMNLSSKHTGLNVMFGRSHDAGMKTDKISVLDIARVLDKVKLLTRENLELVFSLLNKELNDYTSDPYLTKGSYYSISDDTYEKLVKDVHKEAV